MVTQSVSRAPPGSLLWALAAVLSVAATAILGSLATLPNIPTWYASLEKPSFTPRTGLFNSVWITLYALMASAAWSVLSIPRGTPGRDGALTAFFVQLALNAAWSWAFFGLRSPLAGLLVILPLLIMILVTLWRFRPLDRLAAALLAPSTAWVAFATVLNIGIWRLNP